MEVFDVYFASLMSMQVHPGAGQRGHIALTPEQCAELAMRMLEVRARYIPQEEISWLGAWRLWPRRHW